MRNILTVLSRRRAAELALLCLLASACAGDAVEPDVCGNGLLEAGEDCDPYADAELGEGLACGEPPAANACRYLCEWEDQSCPEGWGCGDDGICRAATGVFELTESTAPFALERWETGSQDGDGAIDVVGFAEGRITARLGDGSGRFDRSLHRSAQHFTGTPGFGDLDGDGRLDVLAPFRSGLVRFVAEASGLPEPLLEIGPILGDTAGNPRPYFAADARPVLVELEGFDGVSVLALAEDAEGYPPLIAQIVAPGTSEAQLYRVAEPLALPEAHRLEDLAGEGRIPVADLDGEPAGRRNDLALGFTTSDKVWILSGEFLASMEGAEATVLLRQEIQLPAALDGGVRFVDLSGDGELDLLAPAGGEVYVAPGRGDGTFDPPALDTRFDALADPSTVAAGVEGRLQRGPIGAADLDGDGLTDFVSPNGIFLQQADGSLEQSAKRRTGAPWAEALAADLNADGELDLAVRSASDGEVTPGMDLLLGDGGGAFFPVPKVTDGDVEGLALGDFDGDGIDDVAVHEDLGQRDAISALFGAGGGLLGELQRMGTYDEIVEIDAGRGRDLVSLEFDLPADVFALAETPFPVHHLLTLFGTPERAMVAPRPMISRTAVGPPESAFIGSFAAGSPGGDLAAVARFGDSRRLYRFSSIGEPRSVPYEGPDPRCAPAAAVDLDGDGVDELVSVGGCDAPAEVRVATFGEQVGVGPGEVIGSEDERVSPQDLAIADLDGDGMPDVAVAFAGPGQGAEATIFWNQDGDLSSEATTAIPRPPESHRLWSVAPVNADEDPHLELAILGDRGLYLAQLDGARAAPPDLVPLSPRDYRSGGLLRAADVDGDGLEDLLASSSDRRSLDVYTAISHLEGPAVTCTPEPAGTVMYMNREGGQYEHGPPDSSLNETRIFDSTTTVSPWTVDDERWFELLSCVRDHFAPFDVLVTDQDPGFQPHLEAVFTDDTSLELGLGEDVGSRWGALSCDGPERQISFFFGDLLARENQLCAQATASFAYLSGAEWVRDCTSVLGILSCETGRKGIRDREVACGRNEPGPCQCTLGETTNTFQTLMSNLGPAQCGGPP